MAFSLTARIAKAEPLMESANPDPEFQRIFGEAHELRKQRKFTDAWWRLEDLEPIDRAEPEVLALRLQLCADLGHWELGCSLSAVLRFAYDESHKITCAEFHHAYARVLVDTG